LLGQLSFSLDLPSEAPPRQAWRHLLTTASSRTAARDPEKVGTRFSEKIMHKQ